MNPVARRRTTMIFFLIGVALRRAMLCVNRPLHKYLMVLMALKLTAFVRNYQMNFYL
jgi:uncharacterized membrane protein